MTPADWAALAQAAQTPGATQYLEALAAQRNAELQGIPDVGGGGTPGAPGTSGQYTVGQDAIAAVQAAYPNLAWLLTIPDLAPLIVQWAQTGMSSTAAEAAFESSAWYQTHSQTVRNWVAEVNTDPATAQADLQAQQSSVNATLALLGLKATPEQLTMLAQASLAQGWTPQQVKDHIAQAIRPTANGQFEFTFGGITSGASGPGTLQASTQAIQAEAAKYLVPVSNSTINQFALSLAQGTMDSAAVTAYFQQQAMSLFPSMAGAIKAGITPEQYVTPYKEVAAQVLGVSPDSINMSQQKWLRPLTAPGPDGKPVAMSLYDWQQTIMQDPQYHYMNSINAKDRASSIAQGIAEMFGRVASGPSGSTAFSAAGAPRIPGVPIT